MVCQHSPSVSREKRPRRNKQPTGYLSLFSLPRKAGQKKNGGARGGYAKGIRERSCSHVALPKMPPGRGLVPRGDAEFRPLPPFRRGEFFI